MRQFGQELCCQIVMDLIYYLLIRRDNSKDQLGNSPVGLFLFLLIIHFDVIIKPC